MAGKRSLSRLSAAVNSTIVDAAGNPAKQEGPPVLDRPRCAECYHFQPANAEETQGFCHGRAPTAMALPNRNALTGEMSLSIQTVWPPISAGEWCGDWEPLADEEDPATPTLSESQAVN
jgi:hypothetical protein